jgi:hypothetical protein
MLHAEAQHEQRERGRSVKASRTVLDPAIIRTALVGKERELTRLVDELMRTDVSLMAARSLLACAPEAPQCLSVELVEAISLLRAAETVVSSAYGKIHNCSEALLSEPPAPLETDRRFSGSDRQDGARMMNVLMPGAELEQ